MATDKKKIYVTRRVPQPGLDLLQDHELTFWDSDEAIPKDVLIKNIPGKDALFCMLTDTIDKEVLDAAGIHHGVGYMQCLGLNVH